MGIWGRTQGGEGGTKGVGFMGHAGASGTGSWSVSPRDKEWESLYHGTLLNPAGALLDGSACVWVKGAPMATGAGWRIELCGKA